MEIPSRRSPGEERFYQRLEGAQTGRFDHYYATARTAFYKLRGADDIKRFYEAVNKLTEPNADTPFDQKVALAWSAGEKYENLSNWGFLKSANFPSRENRLRAEGLKALQHFETTLIEQMREEVSGKLLNPKVRKHQKLVEKMRAVRKGASSGS